MKEAMVKPFSKGCKFFEINNRINQTINNTNQI